MGWLFIGFGQFSICWCYVCWAWHLQRSLFFHTTFPHYCVVQVGDVLESIGEEEPPVGDGADARLATMLRAGRDSEVLVRWSRGVELREMVLRRAQYNFKKES